MRFRESNEVIGRIKTPDEGYRALCAAVIAVACDDWMKAKLMDDHYRMNSVEKFLLSDWFLLFSNGTEGSYILRRLKQTTSKYDDSKESKPIKKFDENGNILGEYKSVSDAAWDIHGDRRSIARAAVSGDECYGYYWEFS